MGISDILVALIGGTIIGILGKVVAPGGRDQIPLWLTILCGIGGIVAGTYLWTEVFGGQADAEGFDFFRHLTQIVVAAVLVVIAAGITGRSKKA
ncbi:GlsB/YeaQ/YmgE family stress response membrane protein [Nocardioides cavernaquae]|uniref:GlsB/YeaQ/YmgE family stress response membrane protein n=1 Tax=Nocardioides cavernaquae TaxID=2321396 RepID=A0A3A5H8A1_9ACTN|nr:GlsB/YeaQ/YmgE family stress response membrane protein [Nocardioides cavernaquae]RJS46662.1 GlsB/YeaQ/YmgE family stress response membrane protein [Nocardioides cavernaquae]